MVKITEDQIAYSCKYGKFAEFQKLCETYEGEIKVNDYTNNYTLQPFLILAAKSGSADKIRYLVEKWNADIDNRSDQGLTALMIVAEKGCVDCVKLLLELGADLTLKDNVVGYTALEYARMGECEEIISLLSQSNAKFASKI